MSLEKYKEKMNFDLTSEPSGDKYPDISGEPVFVIQEHFSKNYHEDFRLQDGIVLVSFAIPKGIPTTKDKKILAIQTEDHPLAYADFKGHIPEGEYGAGDINS